jgi:hypothetical protein
MVGFLSDVGGEGGETVVIIMVMVLVGTAPPPCLNDAPCVAGVIDLLPQINHGSIVEAGLEWSFACIALIVRWASGLLHFLFDVATCGLRSLVALAIVIPPMFRAFSRGATDLRSVTMALRPRGHVPSGGHWELPIELYECALG